MTTHRYLSWDWETRSPSNLKLTGAYRYFEDPNTDLLCGGWAFSDEDEVHCWKRGEPCPAVVVDWVKSGGEIRAWNAQFDRLGWEMIAVPRYGFPEASIDQWMCSMAEAAAMSLPQSLDRASEVLQLAQRKDMDGSKVMKKLMSPRKVWTPDMPGYAKSKLAASLDAMKYTISGSNVIEWWGTPEQFERLYEYCRQDVRTEQCVVSKLRRLPPQEVEVFRLDQKVNQRGVAVDMGLIRASIDVVATATETLNGALTDITGWQVTKATKAKDLTAWLQAQGVNTDSVSKKVVASLLAGGDMPAEAREALEIRRDTAKSALAKLPKIVKTVCSDDRLRGNLTYHGAGTGRWTAKGAQLQNVPRGTIDWELVQLAIPYIQSRDVDTLDLINPALDVVSSAIRSCLVASPGNRLIFNDYAAIEGRTLAWLASEDWVLDAYRTYDAGKGPDMYKMTYAMCFGVDPKDVTKAQRGNIGKPADLSLGFGGGNNAFHAMAANYGVVLDDEEVSRIKVAFRESRPKTVQLWRDCEDAALAAVRNQGKVFQAAGGKIKYIWKGGYLWCVLPSKRALAFPSAGIHEREMPWKDRNGKPVMKESVYYWGAKSAKNGAGANPWCKQDLYGGLLAQNATQAIARDIAAYAAVKCESAGYPLIHTVHDELVADTPVDFGSADEMGRIMCEVPAWAEGLPLAVAADEGPRYHK
jgi:DNA polymerase